MQPSVLYIDLETTPSGKIRDVGAIFMGREWHGAGFGPVTDWLHEAHYLCGHNILAHDVPVLKQRFGEEAFQGKVIIDTLLWSPLLFAEHPYHHLVKGYKLVNELEYSNPQSDCVLTRQLLQEELNAFGRMEAVLKALYYHILGEDDRYRWMFDILGYRAGDGDVLEALSQGLGGKVCLHTNWAHWLVENPAELAYALAVIHTRNENSACPSWVLHTHPVTQDILDALRFTDCGDPACKYCCSNLDPREALGRYFGYNGFRSFDPEEVVSLQERTVRAGLRNESFVAVFPTGGGKSLTFQLPALMKGSLSRQLTVVISPLVSLMKDQVDNLRERFGIMRAVAINGLLSPLERQEALEQVEDGSAHILYISPESLRSPTITRLLNNRSIARFVIDEAHCFSSWGQDFRVDYLFIGDFIRKLLEGKPEGATIPVSCFTATAKPQVIADIRAYFRERLGLELGEFITRAERRNLKYEVIEVAGPDDKEEALLRLLRICETPAIVYASRTKKVEELAAALQQANFSAAPFHGQMKSDDKIRHQNSFMNGGTDIMVATSAFGMGVDKDDVKTVIHYNISDSLENYLQEAGRAGRKESIEAQCYILYHESDLDKHFSLLQQTKINQKEIQQVWRAIKSLTKFRENISKSALEIARAAGWDTELRDLETRVKTSLAALEDQHFLVRSQDSPRVFATSLLVRNINEAVEILNRSPYLTDIQKQHATRVLQRLIKEDECRVDYLAETLQLPLRDVQEAITHLRELELLGDSKDLTAFINVKNSESGSRRIIERMTALEKAVLDILPQAKTKTSMRQLNQKLLDNGITHSGTDRIKTILDYWDFKGFISKHRVDRERELYEITFRRREKLEGQMAARHDLAGACFQELERLQEEQAEDFQRSEDLPVQFSLLELRKSDRFFGEHTAQQIKNYEQALLYLHHIKAIKLEGGFMVIYNRLNLDDVDRSRRSFTQEDYRKLKDHYESKVQQIHIVGEYARKRVENYEEALTYVNDYFTLSYEEFLARYFPRRKTEIGRAVTPGKFRELIGDLDTDQTAIVNSRDDNILVLAGPGSGKTRVLVHKIASLLILEDVKPEQFLMLTFSKAAALEFRARIHRLVPEFAGMIKIATFHGYCFELLGQLGNLEKSDQVIETCIEAIRKEHIDISSIANKSVLLLDEFQDVNAGEWELIQTIIRAAGNIRVIAVGDDDQNIYGFRGSSIEYMKRFRDEYRATTHQLLKNYRSRAGIIGFNNALARTIGHRMKQHDLMAPRATHRAGITVTEYASRHLTGPVVKDLLATERKGTTALLTRTNAQALLAASLLQEAGVRVRLVAGIVDFSLANLQEFRSFHQYLEEAVTDIGLVVEEGWWRARDRFKEHFGQSPHYAWCLEVIRLFESQFTSNFELVEWRDYIRQIRVEDALNGEADTVAVTTMHKSKGKEFDSVFLMLEDFDFGPDENKRLLYVACTRARQHLSIHLNHHFFRNLRPDGLQYTIYLQPTAPPQRFEIILGLKDIHLGAQKRAARMLSRVQAGDNLEPCQRDFESETVHGVSLPGNGFLLPFSKRFMYEKFKRIQASHYRLTAASAEYIVFWYDAAEDKEYRVVLPRLRFGLGEGDE